MVRPDCHDAMRGDGSWQKAINGAIVARHAGVSVELTCVVGRHNAAHVDELVDFAEERNFRVVFQPARNSLFQGSPRDGFGFPARNGRAPTRLRPARRAQARRQPRGRQRLGQSATLPSLP